MAQFHLTSTITIEAEDRAEVEERMENDSHLATDLLSNCEIDEA